MNQVAAQFPTHSRSVARRPIVLFVTAALGIASCALPATAQQAGCCAPGGPAEAIGHLPRGVELVLVVDNAGAMRQTAPAAALVQALAGAGFIEPDLQASWEKLAAELGWPAQEAFDRLVGSRLILVVRDVEIPDQRRWAILS